MFVRFEVKNYRSFNSQQKFSLVKTKKTKDNELLNNVFYPENNKDFALLKSGVIYGANASGKSNFLKALLAMKKVITASSQHGNKLPLTPFKLNSESILQPSEFEITFIGKDIQGEDIRYQYGFSANAVQVFDEWLFAFPNGHAQKWFERIWNSSNENYEWKFSSFLKGKKQIWQEATRPNALFLSTSVQLNSEQLKPVFDWFSDTLQFGESNDFYPVYTAELCTKEQKTEVMKFLRAADLNIQDISVETKEFSASELPDDMPEVLRDIISKELNGAKRFDLKTIHLDNDGRQILFEFEEESDGTQKIFSLVGPILDVLNKGNVLCVDELNTNLHPKLVEFLIGLFHNPKTNAKNAQLIFTTHETSILNQEIFRRDQVWFCERNEFQESMLYPLSDFSPKKGKENLELGYLSGRYGALPFIDFLY